MANSLLDFVMSLVRDPDTAARYAADPAGTLAAANLADVTSADVENLIPVVAESLSMNLSASGVDPFGAEPVGNVWASGAATAAFDAFDAVVEQEQDTSLPDRIGVEAFDEESQISTTVEFEDLVTVGYAPEPLAGELLDTDPAVLDEGVPTLGPDVETDQPDQPGSFDLFD
ncbi:Rv0340 family IniB-related protein [Mycolicibacterium vaccae]|uniref:Rv0340 family IniB-related protein n=1 Tax=Mycolicibacterium vaccae TaxID=1810 RepID=UPI003CF3C932